MMKKRKFMEKVYLYPKTSLIGDFPSLIMGYFVAEKDVITFLMASVSVVVVSFAGIQGLVLSAAINGISINGIMNSILGALLFLFIPATIIVALKTVFSIAKS